MEKIKIQFEITRSAFELLLKIWKENRAEYRDTEWNTLEDFKASDEFIDGHKLEEWFLSRNFGGTLYLIDELLDCGLVHSDGESWHVTYILTRFGKEFLSTNLQSILRDIKISEIL